MADFDDGQPLKNFLDLPRIGKLSLRAWAAQVVVDEQSRSMDEVHAGHLMMEHALRLEKATAANKRKKERLEEEMAQLSKILDEDIEVMERQAQQIRAEKPENEQTQELWKEIRDDRENILHAQNWMEQQLREKEQEHEQLREKMAELNKTSENSKEEKERMEQQLREKEQENEQLREKMAELNKTCENSKEEKERMMDVMKPHLPENPENKYPLYPFTGYAIVVHAAGFPNENEMESELKNTTQLAKALFDYGFQVKPMRNPTEQEFLKELDECDKQHHEHNLVFIYIAAHGDSTGFWLKDSSFETGLSQKKVAAKIGNRTFHGSPTILCMTSCRDFKDGVEASWVDLLCNQQRNMFLVNACRLGCRCPVTYATAFIKGMMNIFQKKVERSFLIEIKDLQLKYQPLDFDDRLQKCLVLPACPEENPLTPGEQKEACQKLDNAFKYP